MPWDSEHGCNTPGTIGRARHLGDPLTVEQIRELPDGAEVVITWDGGNGPWPERILVDFAGVRRVEGLYCDALLWQTPGQVRPGHRVTLGWDEEARAWFDGKVPLADHLQERIRQWRTSLPDDEREYRQLAPFREACGAHGVPVPDGYAGTTDATGKD